MNKNNKDFNILYESPKTTVIELQMDGYILTGSETGGTTSDYGDSNGPWGEPWVD